MGGVGVAWERLTCLKKLARCHESEGKLARNRERLRKTSPGESIDFSPGEKTGASRKLGESVGRKAHGPRGPKNTKIASRWNQEKKRKNEKNGPPFTWRKTLGE